MANELLVKNNKMGDNVLARVKNIRITRRLTIPCKLFARERYEISNVTATRVERFKKKMDTNQHLSLQHLIV